MPPKEKKLKRARGSSSRPLLLKDASPEDLRIDLESSEHKRRFDVLKLREFDGTRFLDVDCLKSLGFWDDVVYLAS